MTCPKAKIEKNVVFGINIQKTLQTKGHTFWNSQKLLYDQKFYQWRCQLWNKWQTQKFNHNKQRKSNKFKTNVFIYWYSQQFCLKISWIVFNSFFKNAKYYTLMVWSSNYVFLIASNDPFELLSIFWILRFFNHL